MNCSQAKHYIYASLDAALDEVREKELQAHCAACAACRKEMAEIKNFLSAVVPPAPIAVSPHFMAKVRRRIAAHEQRGRVLVPVLAWIRAGAMAAAVGLVVTAGNYIGGGLWAYLNEAQGTSITTAASPGLGDLADVPDESLAGVYSSMINEG